MKILLLHQVFATPHDSGGTRHYEFGAHWIAAGHEFTVITGNIHLHTGKKIIDNHVSSLADPVIIRARAFSAFHRNYIWRVLSFVSFMITSTWHGLRCKNVDVVIGTTPPIFQAFSAWLVAFLKRCPFILEVRDLWPAFAIDIGVLKNPILISLSRWLERFLYRRAKHIVINSPAYRDYLIKLDVPPTKITLIPNGVDIDTFVKRDTKNNIRQQLGLENKFLVTYAGAFGLANDLDTLLYAAEQLKPYSHIHFLLVGDGKEKPKLEKLVNQLNLNNITFTGVFPKNQIKAVLSASDVCVATLKNIPMFTMTYPNKIFDYMAAGKATILAIDGVIREVIEKAEGGVFSPPGDPVALAKIIHSLSLQPEKVLNMGQRAFEYVSVNFDRKQQAQHFIRLLENITTG